MTKHVGISGSRHGGKTNQQNILRTYTGSWPDGTIVHHGDCVGWDEQVHNIVRDEGFDVIIHPPTDNKLCAFCDDAIEVRDPLPYLPRNDAIVDEVDVLYAAPNSMKERSLGGTWYTIRRAREWGIPIYILWPNGDVTIEHPRTRMGEE